MEQNSSTYELPVLLLRKWMLTSIFLAVLILMGRGLGQGTSHVQPTDANAPGLIGNFYDLKQSNDNPPKPTGITRDDWRNEIIRLVADNLNDAADFSKYLKRAVPIGTGGFSIPEQASISAPRAFGLGDKAQPNLWLVVYHGKASVPETGRYRFVGFGDDLLYVKLNGTAVFDGGWQSVTKDPALRQTYPYSWSTLGSAALLRKGAWFHVNQGDIVKLDVLIGDWGGKCGYFLLLEKDGAKYDTAPDGTTPRLPLFQVGAKIPLPAPGVEAPPLSDSNVVWPAANDK